MELELFRAHRIYRERKETAKRKVFSGRQENSVKSAQGL